MSARLRVHCAELADLGERAVAGVAVELAEDAAHHLARVVRAREGDAIVLFDGVGREARARVARVQSRGRVEVSAELEESPRPGVVADSAGVIWLQGYPKGDKLESVVQKATELGVREVWPVYTARSVPKPAAHGAREGKTARLRAIAASASAQCGRADVAHVREAMGLAEALAALPESASVRILPWEEARDGRALAELLEEAPAEGGCAVLVGPEGGLTQDEVTLAERCGFCAVGFGPRVLRTETVAPALLAVLSYARGDLGRAREGASRAARR